MADNVAITPGVGASVAADEIGGVLYQRVKLSLGANNTAVDAGAGAGAVGTDTQRVTLGSDDPAVAALGAIGGAAVVTDANGTIQQYLRGIIVKLIAQLPATLGAKTAAASTSVTLASDALPPIGGAYTDRSIANLAGTSETLMAANAARRILIVHNIGATAVAVNLTGGTASLTVGGSVVLAAAGSLILDAYPPVGAITVIGTATADLTAYEG